MAEKTVTKTNKRKKVSLLIIYIFIVVILIVLIYAFPKATGALAATDIIEYGSIQITDDVHCYIVRNETVYFANIKGTVGYMIQEGDIARKGTEILSIEPDSEIKVKNDLSDFYKTAGKYLNGDNLIIEDSAVIQTQIDELNNENINTSDKVRQAEIQRRISQLNSALSNLTKNDQEAVAETPAYKMGIVPENYKVSQHGVISYYLDGYEYALNPDTMALLDKSKMELKDVKSTNVCRGITEAGDPLFKIIDTKAWYAVAWIDAKNIGKYKVGSSVKLKLPLDEVKGTVQSVTENGNNVMVTMRFNTYYEELGKIRQIDTSVITSDSKGLLVSNEFIKSKDGAIGVYVKGVTGVYSFTPVKVKASDGNFSILEAGYYYENDGSGKSVKINTVDVYDEIKKNVL